MKIGPKNGMQSIVDNAAGKEMVIIMPDGLDSFYVDGYKDGLKYETYLQTEFIPYIESKYRIDTVNGKTCYCRTFKERFWSGISRFQVP
jgi:S-formylglutathione hydrolase FrmB